MSFAKWKKRTTTFDLLPIGYRAMAERVAQSAYKAGQRDKLINPLGMNDLMATAAFRYCLGRRTYIVGECAEWLIEHWDTLNEAAKSTIKRDLEEAFINDDTARASGKENRLPLGCVCDRQAWERVRKLWSAQ